MEKDNSNFLSTKDNKKINKNVEQDDFNQKIQKKHELEFLRVKKELIMINEEQKILLDSISPQIWYLSDSETCITMNKSRRTFFGILNDSERNHNIYSIMPKDTARLCIEANKKAFQSKKEINSEEWVKDKNGQKHLLSITKTPKLNKNGEVEFVVCFAHDITKKKNNEKELEKRIKLLEYEVEERIKLLEYEIEERERAEHALMNAKVSSEKANQAKSNFLANMSHELRTPLNSIIGFSEILKNGLMGALTYEQEDLINDILESGVQLLSLINDILDLSKIEAGKFNLYLNEVSISDFIIKIFEFFKKKAESQDITFTHEVSKNLCKMFIDKKRLRQILYNLISNALKFTSTGGKVGIIVKELDEDILITIWDTGIGVAKENLSRLFKPFEQINTKLSKKVPGTGLGLHLTKSLVELHNGHIRVESVFGKGTKFSFTISKKLNILRSDLEKINKTILN